MEGKRESGILVSSKIKWNIPNFSQLSEKKLYSDVFIAGDCKWRLLVFPKGNDVDYLSMYLDVADSTSLPVGWSREAELSFTVVNQFYKSATVTKESKAVFNSALRDWGFISFIPLSKVNNPAEKYLVKDTLTCECEVLVLSAVHYSQVDSDKDEIKLEKIGAPEPAVEAPPNQTPLTVQKQKAVGDVEAKVAALVVTDTSLTSEPLNHSKGASEATDVTTVQAGNLPATEGTKIQSKDEAHVQTVSKSLLTELSSMRKKQKPIFSNEILGSIQAPDFTADDQQQRKGALRVLFNLSLQAIQQANYFVEIENNLHALVDHTNDLDEKTILEDTMSRLADLKRSICNAKEMAKTAEARRSSLAGKTADVDSKMEQRQKEISSLESELSTLSESEEYLHDELDQVIAQKKLVSVKLEIANEAARKDIEKWRSLEAEMKQVNAEWIGAKEKLASEKARWDLFVEDLGLGKKC